MSFWNNKQEAAPAMNAARPLPTEVPPAAHTHEERYPMAMMTREDLPVTTSGGSNDLLLGPGAEFEGKLTFKGTVRIDATFKGTIVTNDVLIVGEHARIDANITCGTVVVSGAVNGNIDAKLSVELRHSARVRGDVETPSLVIEKGALLQGDVTMKTGDRSAALKPGASAGAGVSP